MPNKCNAASYTSKEKNSSNKLKSFMANREQLREVYTFGTKNRISRKQCKVTGVSIVPMDTPGFR
jgi:hypothetical protein